jgi:hypothetical protein
MEMAGVIRGIEEMPVLRAADDQRGDEHAAQGSNQKGDYQRLHQSSIPSMGKFAQKLPRVLHQAAQSDEATAFTSYYVRLTAGVGRYSRPPGLRRSHAEACFREHQQRSGTIASAFGKERIEGRGFFELYDTVRIHPRLHRGDDIIWNVRGPVTEVNSVLHPEGARNRTSRLARGDAYEHVAGKEWLKARARAHERKERVEVLAAKIELDPPFRPCLGVDQLPGSLADVRHVGVAHFSDSIRNEGNVQSAFCAGFSIASASSSQLTFDSISNDYANINAESTIRSAASSLRLNRKRVDPEKVNSNCAGVTGLTIHGNGETRRRYGTRKAG